jgi:hypothetical protein
MSLKVSFTEMYPRILWDLFEDPLEFVEHTLETTQTVQ